VNYTAGLSKIRTSPDHGTAYDIAGKGIADHNFKEAVYLALDIYRSRIEYAEISQKPLRVR
jgi:4-hydroxythreonine-4-phosphate dehydrogenase